MAVCTQCGKTVNTIRKHGSEEWTIVPHRTDADELCTPNSGGSMQVSQELADHIEQMALGKYDDGEGWDMVYECMDRQALQELADRKGCTDYHSLLDAVREDASIWSQLHGDVVGY